MITNTKISGRWFTDYNPKPIPARMGVDWDFWHRDIDEIWHAKSEAEALEMIIDIELEHPYFNEEK